jgi:hypothetical protein
MSTSNVIKIISKDSLIEFFGCCCYNYDNVDENNKFEITIFKDGSK